MSDFAIVLTVLFLTFVAPLWIIFHYVTRWRAAKALSAEDERMLGELWESAKRMEIRIHALERILDAETPDWRSKS
ncbi:MAG: envelope stress response membrane protein PspB [Rhodospirillaceae bacterium]